MHDFPAREPVVLLAAVEEQLQRRRARSPSSAKPNMSNLRLCVSVFGMKRIMISDAQDADRQVDQEHPAPVVIVGQPAAEHRPEDRPDHHAAAEQGHRLAVLLARVDVEQGRLRKRNDERAADALERPEQHHLGQRRRGRAQHRCDGEHDDRNQQQPLAPDPVGKPAADRQARSRRRRYSSSAPS